MAIKQLQLLSTTEIADGNFRSLTEIESYLKAIRQKQDEMEALLRQYQTHFAKTEHAAIEFTINRDGGGKSAPKGGGKTIGLDKIHVPKLDVLKKNFSVIEELSDQVDMLDSLYNNVAVNFRSVRGANDTLKNIKMMQKTADAKMQAALKFLNTVGDKYAPTEFRKMVEDTITFMSPHLTFSKNETFIYAYQTKEDHLGFSIYIKLYNLEDDEGHQYPSFYIVFTCILKPATEKGKVDAFYYVTAMHDFVPPGKYPLGKHVSDPARASAMLGIMLDLENISTAIGVLPHNLDSDKLSKSKFRMGNRVASIIVDKDAISFEMLKSVGEEEARTIAASLYVDLKVHLGKSRKTKLKGRVFKDENVWKAQFKLTSMAGEGQVSLNDIDFLMEHFPQLDDRKIRAIVKTINSD